MAAALTDFGTPRRVAMILAHALRC